jgi:hypothetical protein
LTACALIGLAQRVAVIALGPRDLLAHFGSDDLFYYTEIARNVGTGQGLTFDGLHATSGVQPLWMACLVPWATLFQGHPALALRVDLGLATALTLASGLLMPTVVRNLLDRQPVPIPLALTLGTVAGCVWLLHPRVLHVTFEGTEGALAVLAWQLSLLAWAKEDRRGGSLRLGVALGMGTLARIDQLALSASLLVWPRAVRRSGRRTAAVVAPTMLLWGSWLAICRLATGSPVPDSGVAKRLASGRYYALDLPNRAGAWPHLARELHVDWRVARTLGSVVFCTAGHMSRVSVAAILAGALWFALGARRARGAHAARAPWQDSAAQAAPLTIAALRALWPMLLPATVALVSYVMILHHLRHWYALPLQLGMTILASACLLDVTRSLVPSGAARGRALALTVGFGSWLVAAWAEQLALAPRSWHETYLETAQTLSTVTPPGARIGAFNAGILGAFAAADGRRVINLDGVVNHGVLGALRSRTLTRYVDDERVDFIADYVGTVDLADRIFACDLRQRLERVATVPIRQHPGEAIGIWRVRASR